MAPRLPRNQWFIGVLTSASIAAAAHAQDGSLDLVMAAGPQDVPGVEKGPRQRPPETPPVAVPPADETLEPVEWLGGRPWWEWTRATGNWGGYRDRLEESGLSIAGSYTLDWLGVWSGGVRNRASTRTLLDINATFDLEKLADWKGATVFADFYSTDGRGQDDIGDIQGVSNIETDENDDQLAELWFEKWMLDRRIRIKAGKIDANTEFGFPECAGEYPHSAPAYSPTNFMLPTYPDPAIGVVAFVYPSDRCYLGAGLFDGAAGDGLRTGGHGARTFLSDDKSSDWFWIAETGFTWSEAASLGKGRVAGGGWYHTGEFETFAGDHDDGTAGMYVLAEQQLLRRGGQPAEGDDPDADQGVFIFAQVGWADEDVSEIGLHVAGGLTLSGTFAGRDDDAAGVYVSWVDLSDDDAAGFTDDETVIHAFYKCQIAGSVSLRPSISYVLSPSGDSSTDDAVVGSLRLSIEF